MMMMMMMNTVLNRSGLEDIGETVQQRCLGGLFGHVARLPTVVPASAALSIERATDGVSPGLEAFTGPSTKDLQG